MVRTPEASAEMSWNPDPVSSGTARDFPSLLFKAMYREEFGPEHFRIQRQDVHFDLFLKDTNT